MGLLEKLIHPTKTFSSEGRSSSQTHDHAPGSPSPSEDNKKTSSVLQSQVEQKSRADLLYMLVHTEKTLHLSPLIDNQSSLAQLCFNAILVELRDLFRILEGLYLQAERGHLNVANIYLFYDWFEGFYGIITCIFDAEEDVLFSWLEKVSDIKMANALTPKRRKKKKERARDLCWDILELKILFEKQTANPANKLEGLVSEMRDEAEQLASRIVMYMQNVVNELPILLDQHFGFDERRLIEEAVFGNFRATDLGKFVICAYARSILDEEKRDGFLEESLRPLKSPNATQKYTKKFRKKHTDLVDHLAINPLLIGHINPND